MKNFFNLTGKTALITGAGGLLGPKHAEAILECGGNVVLTDWHEDRVQKRAQELRQKYSSSNLRIIPKHMDVTSKSSVARVVEDIYSSGTKINVLINNAAKDPKVTGDDRGLTPDARFEVMTEEYWHAGMGAAVNGTFLVTQAVTNRMQTHPGENKGVVVNIASDLSVIAPDQRLYRKEGLAEDVQNVKPITYSAAKWAIIGMTKYLAVYFARAGIRVNALSPTGVFNSQPDEFVKKLTNIIPMGRMADINEYKGAIAFLCSDASSYMTGHNLIIDGGKSIW